MMGSAVGLSGLPARLLAGRLSRNGIFAVGQGLVLTLCVFLAYRIAIGHTSLERFGVWSLLIAGAAVVRICDVSGGGALARFVAVAFRDDHAVPAAHYVHTVIITGLCLNIVLGIIFWIAAPLFFPLFIAPQHLDEARALVPWVVLITILTAAAYATISAIDGTQRADLRSIVSAVAAVAFLAASWLLIPAFGLVGLAAAQALQQILTLVIGWLVLRSHVAGLGWSPRRWRRDVFLQTSGYALKLNTVGMMGLLFEPVAKFAFNHAGGPGLVALFELASRIVTQIRMLVITAAAPLSPAFAARPGSRDPLFRGILEKATKIAAIAAVGVTLSALAATPVASLLVLNKLSPELLQMNAALTAGWSINTLGLPLYFAAQGLGELRWNLVGQALTTIIVLAAAFFVAPVFGSAGLIVAVVAGLMVSTLSLLFGNAHAFGTTDLLWRQRGLLLGASFAILIMCAIALLAAGLLRDP